MEAALTAALDAGLAATTLWVAWRSLANAHAFSAIVLFVVFGVLMALIWLRLAAPDLALAEAAVGAGLTGVLLLEAQGRIRRAGEVEPPHQPLPTAARIAAGVPPMLLAAGLLALALSWERAPDGIAPLVHDRLDAAGAENPVTAVLLNFRGYDTLLEVSVLFLAVVATMGLFPRRGRSPAATQPLTDSRGRERMLEWFVRRLAPIGVVVAGYLWWRGSSHPGGAFQGGTVLASMILLLLVTRFHHVPSPRSLLARIALVLGLASLLGAACIGLLAARPLLEYPEGWAAPLILIVEAALTVSVGASLAALAIGVPPEPPRRRGPEP